MTPFLTFDARAGEYAGEELFPIHRRSIRARRSEYVARREYYSQAYAITHNSWGFRTHEVYEPDTDWVVFGCSHTYGVGLRESETWVSQLESLTGKRIYNTANPGSGWDYIWLQVAHRLLYDPLPPHVIIQTPALGRLSIAKSNHQGMLNLFHWTESELFRSAGIDNIEYNSQVIRRLIFRHLDRAGVTYTLLDWNHAVEQVERNDWARDLAHAGPETNRAIAEQLRSSLRSGAQ
jgi:hypothetical protein